MVAAASASYPLDAPRPGWSEQRPQDWWAASREVIAGVVRGAGGEVAGIGLAGQMHGAVFLDHRKRVIRPALLWNDQRTSVQCQAITERVGASRLLAIAGNPALTGFQAPKILWLRDEEPESYARVAAVLLPKDYVRLELTGELLTDGSDASGTLLLDLEQRTWSREILDALEIPSAWLPSVLEGPEVAGTTRPEISRELGLPPGTPVAAGGGDNAAAAVGNGIISAGLASISIGTSGAVFAHSDRLTRDPSGRIHAFCHAVPERYHLMGVTLAAGGALRWWRDVIERGSYEALDELAAGARPGAEGLLFLPYLTGERTPHLDPHARGAFVGLTSRHGLGHLTRAVMEGVAFSLRDSIELMAGLGLDPTEVRITGGGSRSAFWCQLFADVLGKRVVRAAVDEGPAYGAALLAGVAVGAFDSVDQACGAIAVPTAAFEPRAGERRRYESYYESYRKLYSATRAAMHELSDLAGRHDT